MRIGQAEIAFQTENHRTGLPIVTAEHATDHAAGLGVRFSHNAVFFNARAAPEVADLSADIKSGPIVRSRNGRSGAWRLHRHIRG